ncbi:MAG: O-antigen ligase family protein [Oscillospiraceae bacterium]|nr:O-antigen ligase family protein [Oscillospiraceae bacterium]
MPKTAKTIFGTTEKSNFILNMTPESYYDYNLKILTGFLILMPLFSIPLEFFKVYSVPGMALSIIGVFAIVFVFIGFMKDETPKKLYLPAYLLGAMLIWGLVSLYNSYFYSISLFGSDGRSEGWLSLLFYGSFFLLGAQLGTDDNRLKLLHGMYYMGLAECFWSLLQMLPIGFPDYYRNLEPLLLFDLCLPSGLAGSPVFLALILTLLMIPAFTEAVFTEDSKQKLINLICIFCFAMTAIRTQCLIGVIGTVLAILIALVYALVKKAGKKLTPCIITAVIAVLLAFVWSWFSPALNQTYSRETGENVQISNHFTFYDGGIIWEDSSYRLAVSGYYVRNGSANPNGSFEITSLSDSYGYLWKNTLAIIKKYPLAGSGPDSLVYPQLYQNRIIASNPNVFDRCYNYYLHLAGTLGIPMLLLFLALMILTLIRGAKACKQQDSWLYFSIFSSVIVYLLLMLIGISGITSAPLFWMLAGVCISLSKPENKS